ncbi:hypothetical protein FQN60_014987 [Etheostoma spectabile]|uniref:Uncharacterized protein n=1 Tax=Etheostoma spectabile TaxID=54343 RepID=A0A5J5CS88_9PERO|nr:hypothetical protein FQN60_014987 [Etheostoma spectabile]
MVERRSASSRYSSDACTALGRHRSVLARKIPASAAPTAPRPNDHIPIPNSCPSSPDSEDKTAAQTGNNTTRKIAVWALRNWGPAAVEGWLLMVVLPRERAEQRRGSLHLRALEHLDRPSIGTMDKV